MSPTRSAVRKLDFDGFFHGSESVEVRQPHGSQPESGVYAEADAQEGAHLGVVGDFAACALDGVAVGLV